MYEILSLNKYIRPLNRMPLIKCECGHNILLIPDLKAMNKAIANHLQEHAKREHNTTQWSKKQNRIENHLIQQILTKTSQIDK
jgi:hypothetical protein